MEATKVLEKKKFHVTSSRSVPVPKLRFKGFNEDWKIDSLTNLYANIVVGFVGIVSDYYCKKNEGIEFVRTLNVKDGWFSKEDFQFVTKEFHQRNKKSQVKNGDILIARVGANMGLVCEIKGLTGEANSANVIIIKKQDNLSSAFYSLYLSSSKGQKQIQSKGAGGAQEVLNISVAKTINVPFLSLREQQKIASFLSAIGEKIQRLSRKKELLEQYKKGVMWQLFSGKLRFKDEKGKDYPKWEEKRLEQIVSIKKGEQLNASELTESGLYPALNGGINPSGYTDKWNTSENTITISEGGNSCGYINLSTTKFWCGGHCYALLDLNSNTKSDYLFQILKFNELRIMRLRVGSGLPNIQKKDIHKLMLFFPSLEEQKKIANYLTNIDKKIEIVNKQITQTQIFKKGLLQQMFV